MLRLSLALATVAALPLAAIAWQDAPEPGSLSLEVRVVLDVPVAEVWEAFTTAEGITSWMAPVADIDLAIGGAIRATYVEGDALGGPSTTVMSILAYDPERMLALQTTTFPEGSPFAEMGRGTWAIFYFDELADGTTEVTNVAHGYRDNEDSRRMMGFFKQANVMLLEKLNAVLVAKRDAGGEPDAR
jgi:uncharacterized protein YndB with AHSA1/START domain